MYRSIVILRVNTKFCNEMNDDFFRIAFSEHKHSMHSDKLCDQPNQENTSESKVLKNEKKSTARIIG